MGQANPIKTHYSYEEYLALEQADNIRYEYYQGEVFAMAGGTKRHNRIVRNLSTTLEQLLQSTCETFTGDVKIEMHSHSHYVYPDVVVTCDPQDLEDDTEAFIQAPTLIIEVLSKSTQSYDLGPKKDAYMRLPSLEYYVLVAQNEYKVDVYERRQGFWAYTTYNEPTQPITFTKLNLTLKVSQIYQRVAFEVNE